MQEGATARSTQQVITGPNALLAEPVVWIMFQHIIDHFPPEPRILVSVNALVRNVPFSVRGTECVCGRRFPFYLQFVAHVIDVSGKLFLKFEAFQGKVLGQPITKSVLKTCTSADFCPDLTFAIKLDMSEIALGHQVVNRLSARDVQLYRRPPMAKMLWPEFPTTLHRDVIAILEPLSSITTAGTLPRE